MIDTKEEPEINNLKFIITESLGHAGQWKQGECIRCGEKLKRKQGGDLDDWWLHDFHVMLKNHKCAEIQQSASGAITKGE